MFKFIKLFFITCFFIKIYICHIQWCDYDYSVNKNNIYKILAKEKYDDTKYTYKKKYLENVFIDLHNAKISNISTNILIERILYENSGLEEELIKYLDIIQDEKLSQDYYMQKHLIYGYNLSKQKKYLDSINVFLPLHKKCTDNKSKTILNFYLAYNYYKLHEYDTAYTYMSNFYNNFKNNSYVKYKLKNNINRKQLLLLIAILFNKGDNYKIEQIIGIINNKKIKCSEYILSILGDYYSRNRNYTQAINFYNHALLLTKNKTMKYNILLKKIITHYSGNDIAEMRILIDDVKKNSMQLNCTMKLQLAMLLMNIGDYKDALDVLQNCDNDENKADILFLKAICYYDTSDIYKTIEILKEIKDNYQQYNLINNVNMLYVYLNCGGINYNHIINKISNNNTKYKNNNNKIITTMWHITELTKAIKAYKNKEYDISLCIAQDLLKDCIYNTDIRNIINLLCAEIYCILKQYTISIQYYNKVLDNTHILDMQSQALYGLGYCYFAIKQYKKALVYFNKISLNQYYNNENVKNNIQLIIADSLLCLKEYQKAEEIYKNLKNKTIHSQYNLGIAFEKQNKNDEAINTFKGMLEKCIDMPQLIHYKILFAYINCFKNDDKIVNFIKTECMKKKRFKLQDINNITFEILKIRQETYDIDLLRHNK